MAVSGLSSYDVMYQWQGQQLKNIASSSNGTNKNNNPIANIFSGSSITNQVSSMIELTRYAMDAMGVGNNGRVTFSQITKYRQQLQTQFNQGVKNGFANSGISNISSLSFSLDKKGVLSVQGENQKDREQAQAWLDANPYLASELQKALQGLDYDGDINFQISSTGKLTVINAMSKKVQAALDADADIGKEIKDAFEQFEINLALPISMTFDEDGNLRASGDNSEEINQWLSANSTLASKIKRQLEKTGADPSSVTLRLNQSGSLQATVRNAELDDVQKYLDKAGETGKKIQQGLNSQKIDPNINFTLQVNDDGSINIISDHPDRDKVQRFFENNPELVKKYRQIETLAGIDDARKSMQISPTEMRKRIQIESMASWWSASGNAASYFGNYSDGSLSLLAGLNLKV